MKLELDITIDQCEAIIEAALALYSIDINLSEDQWSLEPEVMRDLHAGLVRLGHAPDRAGSASRQHYIDYETE